MIHYPSPSFLLSSLRQGGYRASKSLGQHFLADEHLLSKIAEATKTDDQTLVVEIGAGPATLTTMLARRAGGVLAVELDKKLQPFHERIFGATDRVRFVYEDALKLDLWELAREHAEKWNLPNMVLAGNIPFQITSPLLFGQCGPDQPWSRMVLMVQREVADRIAAGPHNRRYGVLTVKLAYWWRVAGRFEVPAESFRPSPKVNASVLILDPGNPAQSPSGELWPDLSKMIDCSFSQRRKKLYNSLSASWNLSPGKEAIRSALEEIGVNPDARAENLSPLEFQKLHGQLTRCPA